MKVLIAYGTRYGATKGIAEKMAEWIKASNIDLDIVDVKKDHWPEITQYDGLIVGSGIKIGRWTKEIKNFFMKNKTEINTISGPIVFFVSSGYAAIPERYEEIKEEYCKNVLDELGVNIDKYEAFGGIMNVSPDSPVGWLDKRILKIAGKESPKFDPSGVNDYRDWNKIEKFTQEFIEAVKTSK